MRVHDLDRTEVSHYFRPQNPTRLSTVPRRWTGEFGGANKPQRKTADNGVAVVFVCSRESWLKDYIPPEVLRYNRGLIERTTGASSQAKFLQAHHIRRQTGNHFSNTRFRAALVQSDAAMNVVCGDA